MHRTRLLLVEDDPAMVELLRWTFEKEDFQVAATDSGEEALLLAHERSPDIVLLDWMIEELAGIEVCRRLRNAINTDGKQDMILTGRSDVY